MGDTAEAIEEIDDGYNHEYEVMEQQKVVWVSDGHFIDQSWVSLGEAEPVQPLYTDKIFLLTTCLRHPSALPVRADLGKLILRTGTQYLGSNKRQANHTQTHILNY